MHLTRKSLRTALPLVASVLASCGGEGPSEPPRLMNLGVAIIPANFTSGKSFIEFYGNLGTVAMPKRNPTFEYRLVDSATLVAPVEGHVEIRPSSSGDDSSVFITPTGSASRYLVMIDHVTDLLVQTGDHVTAGQALGSPGVWNGEGGRSELQINDPEGNQVCPTSLLDPSISDAMSAQIDALMLALEIAGADTSYYDEPAMVFAGCLVERFEFGADSGI
jgi:hypothetical protein